MMQRALAVAAAAHDRVSPNPMVGAVVVGPDGCVVGEAATTLQRHAEPAALDAAGAAAFRSTLYVTLEPCCHYGKTPPCVDAVLASGVCRVVVAQQDPDPRASGEGIAALRANGLDVEVGVCESDAMSQLEAYRHHRSTGLPFVVVKLAMTLDGRTAAPDGTSRWITGSAARADAHELRRSSDAVLVGSGTVLADDPQLTVRTDSAPAAQPLRVVLDSRGRVGPDARLFSEPGSVIVYTLSAPEHACQAWRVAGAEVLVVPQRDVSGQHVRLTDVLSDLGERGVLQLMVEGGPTVAGAFVRAGYADRLVVYVGPVASGGDDAYPVLAGPAAATIGEFRRFCLDGVTRLDNDVRLDYRPA